MFANALGQMLAGVGGGVASIDNHPITGSVMVDEILRHYTVGGALGWYDDEWAEISTQLFPAPANWDDPAGLSIVRVHKITGETIILAKRGCSTGYADHRAWVAFDGGDPIRHLPPFGMFASDGWFVANASPAALSPDGAICYRYLDQYGFRVREAGGSDDWELSASALYAIQLLAGRRAVALTPEYGVFVHGLTAPLTVVRHVRDPRLVEGLPEPWISYWDDETSRRLFHPWNDPRGYVVQDYATEGDSFGFTARALDAGRVIFGWAIGEGQQPGQTRTRVIDLTSPRVDLTPAAPPIVPTDPITVTITAAPTEGPVPLEVRAEATVAHGPATSIAWGWRPRGDHAWRIAATNPGSDPDHTFRFDTAGEYEIAAVAEGPNGSASSDLELVSATSPGPEPPHPPKPRTLTKGLTMEIDGKVVQLRGAGLKLIAPDTPGTGIWGASSDPDLKEWRGVIYVGDGATSARYLATKIPGDRYTFTNVESGCLAGADGGQYSPGLDRQIYHKPTGNTDAGDLEKWRVYTGNEIGIPQAQIEQTSDASHPAGAGKKIVVAPLTVEIVQ